MPQDILETNETLVDSLHITDLLQDVLPGTRPYFEKVYGEKHAISLPITKKGIGLPRAVSSPEVIEFI